MERTGSKMRLMRTLLFLYGKESTRFLQTILTNSVGNSNGIVFAGFLNHLGRVLSDGFVYRRENGFLLDLPHLLGSSLENHFRRYFVCPDLFLEDVSHRFRVYVDSSPFPNAHKDPRHVLMGYRCIAPADSSSSSQDLATDSVEYHRWRMRAGVPECPYEIRSGKSLPLDMNLDVMGGIDFSKGCYLGQELVARTRRRGPRRRVFPMKIESKNEWIDKYRTVNQDLYVDGQRKGILLSRTGSDGLALMYIDGIERGRRYCTENGKEIWIVRDQDCKLEDVTKKIDSAA